MSAKGKAAVHEAPVDPRHQREEFVRSFLHKSAELAEELIRDNQSLEQQLQREREDNARLRAQLSSNDAARELLFTIDRMEEERRELMQRSGELTLFERRQADTERELNDLASLYVASFQLSSSLSLGRVIKHMCELMEQLCGGQSFVFYLLTQDGKRAIPVSAQGRLPAPLVASRPPPSPPAMPVKSRPVVKCGPRPAITMACTPSSAPSSCMARGSSSQKAGPMALRLAGLASQRVAMPASRSVSSTVYDIGALYSASVVVSTGRGR